MNKSSVGNGIPDELFQILKDDVIKSYHFMANRWENNGNSDRLYFWGASKLLQMETAAVKLKDIYSLEEKL